MDECMPPPRCRRGSLAKSPSKTPHRASRPSIKQSDSTLNSRLNSALRSPRGGKSSFSLLSNGSRVSSCPTSAMSFRSSNHGRQRRQERNIGKLQLKAALKYGTRSSTHVPGRSKYVHNGITFIVDDITKQEVTSFATAMDLPLKTISSEMWENHEWARQQMKSQPETFAKSHSVILIDISGSMRNSDVQGSRTRLGAVWHALAEDYVRQRIESGNASLADVFSVILMGNTARLHPYLHNVPTDWITYNAILKIYKEGSIMPGGHSCFRPALSMAERILSQYESSPCFLMLTIMSDGRPSDSAIYGGSWEKNESAIAGYIATMSSRFGKRLTVSTVGMGSQNQFETLKTMTEEALNHESKGIFQVPSLSSSSIAGAISSIATSLTETQLDAASFRQVVRRMTRENRKMLPALTEVVDPKEFDIYMSDNVEHLEYDPSNKLYFFKKIPFQHPDARGVAVAKKAFGEGTERFAKQFFEVAADGITVVGEPLVAKESKFVVESTLNLQELSEKFVRRFCRINHQAQKVADAFNAKLDSIPRLDPDTVRVSFLPCSVYRINDREKGVHVLGVENRLFGRFEKWNSNNGYVRTRTSPHKSGSNLVSIQEGVSGLPPLAAIKEEGVSPDEVGSTAVVGSTAEVAIEIDMDEGENLFATHNDVAQAFSHFSYVYGGRKSLICDLQGVVDRQKKLLRFTDPAIHFFDCLKENKRGQYGRTDRGEKGIEEFLTSHDCNCLCNVTTKGFMEVLL